MKRILVGFIQDGRHSGIDKYLLVFCRACHEKGIKLDFMTDEVCPEMESYLNSMDFGIYAVPGLKRPLSQYRAIMSLLEKDNYDAIYLNISEAFNCMGLAAAKKCGIPIRIVHSHSSGVDRQNSFERTLRKTIHRLARHYVSCNATRRYGCSTVAGKWMFDNDFEIVYNAVDMHRFLFNADTRAKMRSELGLGGQRTLIHIGHFCYAKNNFFLMDIMREVVKLDPDAVLLSVGTGVDFDAVRDYAKSLGIDKNIRFLGVRADVPELLCASDVFVFPSRFEGLSITCIESQFSGVYSVLSDTISKEVKIARKVSFLPIKDPSEWAKLIVSLPLLRESAILDDTAVSEYDIENQKRQFDKFLED